MITGIISKFGRVYGRVFAWLAQCMNPYQATVKLTYDKVKDGLVSIKLRICYQQDRPRYHLPVKEGILVKPDVYKRLVSFHQARSNRASDEIQQLYKRISPFIERAEQIIAKLPIFSFAKFDRLFYAHASQAEQGNDVISSLMGLSAQMEKEGRIGNADAYKSAAKSVGRFVASLTGEQQTDLLSLSKKEENPILRFEQVSSIFLDQYEQWMLKYGTAPRKPGGQPGPASMTTVGIYLRQVRAAFNAAIKDKVIPDTVYPFGRKGFVVPSGTNTKKALNKAVILQLMAYACEPGSFEERSRDLWILSYLSNGMNLSDICSLRWHEVNYQDETITFTRNKTSRTRRGNQQKVVASLFPESRAIVERWAGSLRTQTGYVFSFLSEDMDARRRKTVITQVVKVTNKYMKRIAQDLGLKVEIKTYEARHSFASAILKGGGDLVYIKDKLGQSSLKSTEAYLTTIHDEDEQAILRKSLL